MVNQFFLLDSDDAGFAAAISAIETLIAPKFGFTPAIVQRAAAHDATHVVVKAPITEAELDADADLADLRTANYPTALCRTRWTSRAAFRRSGFHALNESIRSYEAEAGGVWRYVRPQSGKTDGNPGVPAGPDYGENSDGTTVYDAHNSALDGTIKGVGTSAEHQVGYSYDYCFGAHVRGGHMGAGGNIDYGNGGANQGLVAVADATAGRRTRFYFNNDMSPGLFWGSYTLWERHSALPWELYDTGIYVQGRFQENGSGQNVGATSVVHDADIEDITVDADTLMKRHHLKGKASLSDLNGTTGRGRYHVQAGGFTEETWDAVHVWDGSSFTDVTTAANNATVDDFEAFAASAPNGAYIAFISSNPFSMVRYNPSQAQVGGTLQWEYSQGSAAFGAFTNENDGGSAWGVTFEADFEFNPKSDWATDTVNGSTGYVVRLRKTAGTITTAGRGDQAKKIAAAMFIHRWNDGAPTRGVCHAGPAGAAFNNGLRHDLLAIGNYEYVNARHGGAALWQAMKTCTDVVFSGSQLLPFGDMQTGATDMGITLQASETAKNQAVWWGIDDVLVQAKTHAVIQGVLAEVQRSIDNADGGDLTKFDDMGEWSDIAYAINGPYSNISVNGGALSPQVINGCRIRKVGMKHDLLNDTEAIDLFINIDPTDHHSLALRGGEDAAAFTLERLGLEYFQAAIELHPTASGDNDVPVGGATSPAQNYLFQYGYHCQSNGYFDSGQPLGAFKFSGNNEIVKHEDGTAGSIGQEVKYWGFDEINDTVNSVGDAIISNQADPPVLRYLYFGDNVRWWWTATKSFGPESHNVVTFDGTSTYNDISSNLLVTSGGTPTALFPTGAAGEICYIGVNTRVIRRIGLTISTAGVGAPTLAFEYHNGSTWAAVSNLSDGTSGLTASGDITFDRPTDGSSVSVNSLTKFWLRIRIVSGSFSTVPQASQAHSRWTGPEMDIKYYSGIPIHGIGRVITNRWSGAEGNSGVILDDHATITLQGADTSATKFYKIGSTTTDTPASDLSEWQAFSKSKTDTDAETDSVFAPNATMA